MTRFRRVLVANRGEIAVRVIRALKTLDIESVAIYSDADSGAQHVSMADRAYRLPGVFASETYLDAEKIIDIAKKSECDALHPGYGLLSESGEFSSLCRENGIKFVGPSPETLAISGNKLECKKLAEENRIPVVSYTREPLDSPEEAASFAEKVGFPVLLKSAFGGGGRGIREAKNKHEIISAFEASKREAESSFGKFAVYVEKKLVSPRHLEVQIVASDDSREVVHLGERECSIQRRYQKLVEISPSPALDERARNTLFDLAVKMAKLVKYSNVGTIEFLRDSEGRFYFLEINSRLQVEHPVTEFVSGLDVVNTQFEIAANKKIPFAQNEVKLRGCAIEFRINAEDPLNDFSPTTGKVDLLQIPSGPGVRVDTALQPGMVISPYYDSLIAKLIVSGESFDQARKRAILALDGFGIFGVDTTLSFHRELVRDENFSRGNLSTTFIESSDILKRISHRSEGALDDDYFMIASLLLSRNQFTNPKVTKGSDKSERSQGSKKRKRLDQKPKRGGRFIDAI